MSQKCPRLEPVDRLEIQLEKMSESTEEERDTNVVTAAIILSLQKMVESFCGFMNPSISRLVVVTCRLSAHSAVAGRVKGLS